MRLANIALAASVLGLAAPVLAEKQPVQPRKIGSSVAKPATASPRGGPTLSHTFPSFNTLVTDAVGSVPLPGAPAGTYTAFNVSLDWSLAGGDPFSDEGIFALTDTASIEPGTVFYADPGPAPNSQPNANPVTLNWSGYLDTTYAGGTPLNFLNLQTFTGSSANWNNVSVTINNAPRNVTNYSGDTTGDPTWNRPFADFSGLSSLATATPFESIPFFVDTTTTYDLASFQSGWDGYVFIYQDNFDPNAPLVNGVAGNDDGTGVGDSLLFGVPLQANRQYFLVHTGFENPDFGPYSGTITNSSPDATGRAIIGIVPEPGALALFALAGPCLLRRRR